MRSSICAHGVSKPECVALPLGASVWDASIHDAYATCYRRIARNAKSVVEKGEQDKKAKYATLLSEYLLVPSVIDTAGVWGEKALRLVGDLGKRIVAR